MPEGPESQKLPEMARKVSGLLQGRHRPDSGLAKPEPAILEARDEKDVHCRYACLRRMVREYAAKAGLPAYVTPHTLRRSCTTELLRGGAGMYHVKDLLGHESLDTLKHYARLTITDLRKTHAACHPREKDADGM